MNKLIKTITLSKLSAFFMLSAITIIVYGFFGWATWPQTFLQLGITTGLLVLLCLPALKKPLFFSSVMHQLIAMIILIFACALWARNLNIRTMASLTDTSQIFIFAATYLLSSVIGLFFISIGLAFLAHMLNQNLILGILKPWGTSRFKVALHGSYKGLGVALVLIGWTVFFFPSILGLLIIKYLYKILALIALIIIIPMILSFFLEKK